MELRRMSNRVLAGLLLFAFVVFGGIDPGPLSAEGAVALTSVVLVAFGLDGRRK